MTNKRKRIIKLVGWSVVLIGCILTNYYQYLQKPNPVSLCAMIIIGIILVIVIVIHLILLKRGY